jgi:hypothetical protein
MKTAIGLFDTNHDAESAIQTLGRAGFEKKDISVTVRKTNVNTTESSETMASETMADEGLQTGTLTGMVAGGLMGLLVGAGLLIIPGIGPVLAVGPLAAGLASGSALVGAAAGVGLGAFSGGLIGVLSGMGVPNEHAQIYSEGVRRGDVLVVVHTDESHLSSAEKILRENGAADPQSREQEYRAEGWDRFDPDAGPHENTNSNFSTSNMTNSNMTGSSVTGSNMTGSNMTASSEPALGAASSVIQHRPEESFNPSSVPGSSGAIDPVTGDDYARSSKLGTAAGAVSGAATGAFVGSAGGPIGTIVGGVIGAVVGGGLGAGLDATAKSEEGQTLMGTGETRDAERTSGWHDHDINSDEDERARAQDTTGLAGVSLEDSIQGTLESPPTDHPGTEHTGSTVEERIERTIEAENSLRGRIH